MIIRHFDIQRPDTQPPNPKGWRPTWHGYWELEECETASRTEEYKALEAQNNADGIMSEVVFERDCLLSILAEIKSHTVHFIELGAGWGRMSLAVASIIDHKLLPSLIPQTYFCLAVEAEPQHYLWLKDNFMIQKIKGNTLRGAISNTVGKCKFDVSAEPKECYGQAIKHIRPWDMLSQGTISIQVKKYTIDWLIPHYQLEHIDLIDIDVQGEEYKVIQGAKQSIRQGLIDYFMIGTHHKKYHDKIANLLTPQYELIINILPNSIGRVNGFPPIQCHDGIQLYKRKELQ